MQDLLSLLGPQSSMWGLCAPRDAPLHAAGPGQSLLPAPPLIPLWGTVAPPSPTVVTSASGQDGGESNVKQGEDCLVFLPKDAPSV